MDRSLSDEEVVEFADAVTGGGGAPSAAASTHLRSNHILAKLLGSAFLIAFSFHFLLPTGADAAVLALATEAGRLKTERCDLFSGKWVPNPAGPAYTNSSCKFIDSPQDCMKNGRPDTGYLYWRWQPYGCDLPPLDAQNFLDSMRDKALAMIGDSIFRNHIESLLCLLSKVEQAAEIYHDDEFKSRTWHFPSYNFTAASIWSPFLLDADITDGDRGGVSRYDIQLRLDALDRTWTDQYHKYDYVVISGGQWYLKTAVFWENGAVVGCHYCPGKNLPELGFDYSYRKALRLAFGFMAASDHKPVVLFRTWTPSHFEFGEWYSGGLCNRTRPAGEGEFAGDWVGRLMRELEVEEFTAAAEGTRLRLLDTYHLSLLRPDGHPGPYRTPHPDLSKKPQNDCLHWCLPGPVDAWNDMVADLLMREQLRVYSSS